MLKKANVFVLYTLISYSTVVVLGGELLKNGGFENITYSSDNRWTTWGSNAAFVSDTGYYTGSSSAKISWSDSGMYQEYTGVQTGNSFVLEGDIISPANDKITNRNAYLKLEFWDSTHSLQATEVGVLTPANNSNQWYHFSGQATAPAGTTKVRVAVFTYDPVVTGSGKAYFDNVSLTKIPAVSGPDYNNDQIIDFLDFASLAVPWKTNSSTYDLDGDGFIDLDDLKVFAEVWLNEITFYPDYEFVWSDEFDVPYIKTQTWTFETGNGSSGWGNNELEYYTNRLQNAFIENGCLVIQALKESYGGKSFTSARMKTATKQDFLYGKIEARIKVPTGQGIWPAFWMMPTDSVYGGWPASGEIDIMETANLTDFIDGTIHYGGAWHDYSGGRYATAPATNFADDFHIYTVEWDVNQIRWYVDGHLYSAKTSWWSSGGAFPAPFNQRFYIILNVAVGGNYTGCTSTSCVTATFPQQMLIDWVRIYKRL